MKKIIKLYLIVTAIILTGCDPDDGKTNNTTATVVGKWQLTNIVFGVGSTEEPLDECDLSLIYQFNENGSIERYYETSNECNLFSSEDSYTLDNNNLTINSIINDSNGFTYIEQNTVQVLNSTTLKYIEVWNSIDGNLPPESRTTYTYSKVE